MKFLSKSSTQAICRVIFVFFFHLFLGIVDLSLQNGKDDSIEVFFVTSLSIKQNLYLNSNFSIKFRCTSSTKLIFSITKLSTCFHFGASKIDCVAKFEKFFFRFIFEASGQTSILSSSKWTAVCRATYL